MEIRLHICLPEPGKRLKFFLLIALITIFVLPPVYSQITSYKPGEKVEYTIHYGMITGGVATLDLTKDTINGKEVWHSVFVAKTTGLADAIYKVLDVYESYFDPETELPLTSVRNIREGRYRKYNVVQFDHYTRPDSAILTSDLTGVHITPQGIMDINTCFYYLRNNILPHKKTFTEGEMITILTWFTDELYPIKLKYIGTEVIKTKAGRINCYKFNPVTETGRLFKTEEDVSFWFSTDKNFLPVKIRFDIFVGAFTVELTNYEGLMYPLEFIEK